VSHRQPKAGAPRAVEMEGVELAFNHRPVLAGVELSVAEGDFVAVVGPNGGGKTTLLKLVTGLLRPSRGRVRVMGTEPAQARPQVGYLAQHPELDPDFPITVEEVVRQGRLGAGGGSGPRGPLWPGRDREAAAQALERVGLAELGRRPFGELSGGQRQRVLIARALATRPRLLLMDEPTAGVDPAAEEAIYDLLRELNREMTILVVSHDLGFVSPYVDHVICVNRWVATHPTAEVDAEVIRGMYGRDVRLVRHDHQGPPGGCACE
jgi:zinc transport system ATP-binding protein